MAVCLLFLEKLKQGMATNKRPVGPASVGKLVGHAGFSDGVVAAKLIHDTHSMRIYANTGAFVRRHVGMLLEDNMVDASLLQTVRCGKTRDASTDDDDTECRLQVGHCVKVRAMTEVDSDDGAPGSNGSRRLKGHGHVYPILSLQEPVAWVVSVIHVLAWARLPGPSGRMTVCGEGRPVTADLPVVC